MIAVTYAPRVPGGTTRFHIGRVLTVTAWIAALTAPLGLVGVVPMLLTFNQPFGFNAILGLIGLAGILMR